MRISDPLRRALINLAVADMTLTGIDDGYILDRAADVVAAALKQDPSIAHEIDDVLREEEEP